MHNPLHALHSLVKSILCDHVSHKDCFETPFAILVVEIVVHPFGFREVAHCAAHAVAVGEQLVDDVAGDVACDACHLEEDQRGLEIVR